MSVLIKKVRDRHIIEFDSGAFDSWCVYLSKVGERRYAPRDTEYFKFFKQLGELHGYERVYNDYLKIYELTDRTINPDILRLITQLSDAYSVDNAEEIDIWLTIIYAGMVAEENKEFAILKKRIKRLGMHQVLIELLDVTYAANFSKGKKWRELDSLMKLKGF